MIPNGLWGWILMIAILILIAFIIMKKYLSGKILLTGVGIGYLVTLVNIFTIPSSYFVGMGIFGLCLLIADFIMISLKKRLAAIIFSVLFLLVYFLMHWHELLLFFIALINGFGTERNITIVLQCIWDLKFLQKCCII